MLRLKTGAIILDIAVRCDVNQDGDVLAICRSYSPRDCFVYLANV